jgi:hypothetical protein
MQQPRPSPRYYSDATRAASIGPGELPHRLDVLDALGGVRLGFADLIGCARDERARPEAIWRLTIGPRALPEDFALRGGEFVPVLVRPWTAADGSETARPRGPREPAR